MFRSPMINIYSRDLPMAQAFYTSLGFKGDVPSARNRVSDRCGVGA